jgi:hypothetical protein
MFDESEILDHVVGPTRGLIGGENTIGEMGRFISPPTARPVPDHSHSPT